jgi:tellurite resistance protein TehA-like permease
MKQKSMSEMTTEELQKNEKTIRVALIVIGICIVIMIISSIYLYSKKGFSVSTIMPAFFLPILGVNIMNWKKIKAEIASRG